MVEENHAGMVECRLCQIMALPASVRQLQDTVLKESVAFEWIPGLGAFVEGYSLLVCRTHMLSTADLAHEAIVELQEMLAFAIRGLSAMYGTGVVAFEHGAMTSACHAGSCIAHHHIHLVPVDLPDLPNKLEAQFEKIIDVRLLSDLPALQANRTAYIVTVRRGTSVRLLREWDNAAMR